MKYYIHFILLWNFSTILHAQNFYHQWPFAVGEKDGRPGLGASLLDFNGGQVSLLGPFDNYNYQIGTNSGFICNQEGHLRFASNGCALLDNAFKPYAELDTLTLGETFDWYCPDHYASSNRTFIVPDLSDPSISLLVYHRGEYDDNVGLRSWNLFSTVIGRSGDSLMVIRRQDTLRHFKSIYGPMGMIPHDTEPSWWVVELEEEGRNGWLSYLINKDTILAYPKQSIGPNHILNDIGNSQITFSPNGKKMAFFTHKEGVFIFDFDRSTGKISNQRNYWADWMQKTDTTIMDGSCFSPNSEILYISSRKEIYQIVEDDRINPFYKITNITPEQGSYTIFPLFVGELQLGPDCRMYIGPSTGAGNLSVIHHPNRIGDACGFEYRAIEMPTRIPRRLPSTTYYHLGTGTALCDSSIQWLSTSTFAPTTPEPGFDIFPNPTHSSFQVQLDSDHAMLDLTITDLTGRIVHKASSLSSDAEMDITPLGTGIYFVHVRHHGDYLGVRKLVVTR